MPTFCNSYWPGHKFEGMSAHKSTFSKKRIPVTLKHVGGTEFLATQTETLATLTFYHHDPETLIAWIQTAPNAFSYAEGSHYLNYIVDNGIYLVSISSLPLTSCALGRWDPKHPPSQHKIKFNN